ncbi:MAG: DUF1501 domain-containing protein [Gammaproteobacteria bacterium]|nr:DUF1501 domain-containing protein [Gammaproteobacteria bacterium]
MKKINRREFVKRSGAAAAVGAAFAHYPGMAFSQGMGTTAPFGDYRALVCLFLHGGNDSYNMIVPRSNAEYNVYAASRQNMAIAQQDLLPINPLTPDGADYGLHPSMSGVQTLFEQGRAAFVNNIGPLVEPTTKTDFFNKSVLLPPQLFSHNDQQDQWHSLKGATVSSTGWAGRIADLIRDRVAGQLLATNVSLHGSSLYQAADETIAYVMGSNGPIPFTGFSSSGDPADLFYQQRLAFERVLDATYDTVYERGFAEIQKRAVASVDLVNDALALAPTLNTVFPQSDLGNQMRTVAQLIAVKDELQMERQVFLVEKGGFDSHDDQLLNQPDLLADVSDSVKAFYDALVEIGMADSVTTFTQSDFGRTMTSNGDGTDHAWGGNQFVVGDAVMGQELYGLFPDLALNSDDDVGGGRFIPTTSADQYAATLARWFGVDPVDLPSVAPNINNFAVQDLGFLV